MYINRSAVSGTNCCKSANIVNVHVVTIIGKSIFEGLNHERKSTPVYSIAVLMRIVRY